MSVGILIFVISVIISIITTMRENSHKDRQNQKPPQRTSSDNEPKKGGFFEEIERTFKEISDEINQEEKKTSKRKFDDTLPPLFDELPKEEPKSKPTTEPMAPQRQPETKPMSEKPVSLPKVEPVEAKPRPSRQDNSDEIRRQLEKSLRDDIKLIRNDIDKEKEKQIAKMEKRARDIIEDKYLSERTKRLKLKQLLNSQNVEKGMTKSAFQFDNDEVINGMIWSEILAKPKQL
ncbi:SPOR domain-containing protein [Staphylococcus argenteus]|uniref:SPOR domain-containing protein n=1 Tax=Staphylococcus argenteus TaxID=985002 RepID=UPI001EFE53FF|nr:iron transporter [Staphylococcus argenteus]MCG9802934.1 iron transporter [Staphylococcus argenteus]MCG9810582.1 iron transporter [Staphylococcus argenteus]MCG9823041.1 iron transporter [Staphylococcus argenteus]